MKFYLKGLLISFVFLQSLQGALPPLYQSANEIKAILDDAELGKHLSSGEVIMKIEKLDKGYEIFTNTHRLLISVIYQPVNHPGPAQFSLEFKKTQLLE